MSTKRLSIAAALMVASFLSVGAEARSINDEIRTASLPRDTFSQSAGTATLAPFAHILFCRAQPAECQSDGLGVGAVAWTPALSKLLSQVNARVNRAIRPVADVPGSQDVWILSPSQGDCDDYAVTKRHQLAAAGIPTGALRLVVARTETGEGHAVLMVRTDRGDFILDNRTPRILAWRDTSLTMVKLQSGTDPRRWFSYDGRTLAQID